ncbi:sensor histidine kinase [Paenibacillus periandrae]|uniref:sensor histidine kinase n=1 Tax=Paenibacillus periandrae TaxID=1761741 RepID=UPI001F09683D|nr:sensor histidine kinase [Paenibacillus periandrae]
MRTNLIILFIVFLCLPLLVLSKIWYDKTTDSIEHSAKLFNEQIVRQMNGQLNAYFSDLERSTLPLIAHPLIKEFMSITENEAYNRFVVTRKIESELFQQVVFGRPEIFSFTLYSENGLHVSNQGAYLSDDDYGTYMQLSNRANFNVMGIRWINNTPLLTITRKFTDTTHYQTSGLLVINLRLNEIWNIVNQVQLGNTGSIWIADSNNRIIYDRDLDKLGSQIPDWFTTQAYGLQENDTFIHKENKTDTMVIFNKSAYTDWSIVSEVPIQELNADLIELRNVTIWAALILTLVASFIIGGYSFYITGSLSKLEKLMRQVQDGNLAVNAPLRRGKELKSLYSGFNQMVWELRRLIEEVHTSQLREKELLLKQKESMLRALQSQINPHFLYNTLEMINSYAILEGFKPISRMATALADMFRFCMKDSMYVIPLQDEMDHVRTYLDIQKERFPDLQVDIHLEQEEGYHRVFTARLTLQPLIENCFIHGYEEHLLKPSYIGVFGQRVHDKYIIRIVDHGKGMPPHILRTYNSAFKAVDVDSISQRNQLSDEEKQHVGLMNVHARIRLLFGVHFGLHITQSDDNGTIITLTFPLNTSAAVYSKEDPLCTA